MKLLQQTGRYYVLFSTLIFALWGLGLFFALRYVMNRETDERMQDAKRALHMQLAKMEALPDSIVILDNVIEIKLISEFKPYEKYTDTLIWNPMESEHKMSFRKLSYNDEINGKAYRIGLNRSVMDTEEMLATILLAVFVILGLLLLSINLFNRFLSLSLWKPFYQTIQQIKDFTFDKKEPLSSPPTNIDEFSTLHHAIHQMTSKVLNDYQSLKQFTENASHEIQNPLAIIKSKIELLIQQEGLNEKESDAIQHIQKAARRLSKLSQSLLLLTRIENRQYTNTQPLNLKDLLVNQIDFVEPMISAKCISVETDLKDVFQSMDPSLAEILISNLLGNAIKHNIQEGNIKVVLDDKQLTITNNGEALSVDSHKLFERFHKGKDAAPSLGLGLAIVKEICSSYGFDIRYNYVEQQHSLSVIF